jgi:tRNA-(ms[2]io[6]A)-hydroxylase
MLGVNKKAASNAISLITQNSEKKNGNRIDDNCREELEHLQMVHDLIKAKD